MKIRQIITILAITALIAICAQPVAAATDHDEATGYYNIAEMAISAGDKERALEYFDKALASNTTLLGLGDGLLYTYKDRSAVLTDLGRFDEAILAADQGIALFKKDPGLWNNKGYAYYQMGKFNEAVDTYNTAVTLDPSYLKGWINKGNALMKAGRANEAVDAYSKALQLDPGNADATAGIAEARKSASPFTPATIAMAAIVVIAAGLVIWYVKFRKTDDVKVPGKAKGKK
jgi:tetratricopeptide (TPR) repeat protein